MTVQSNALSGLTPSPPSSAGQSVTVDLAQPIYREQLAQKIKAAIDEYCATAYDDGHRTHLGASLIGRECERYLWYVFRWVYHKKHTGREQRLFNRGHREEDRFVEWLTAIGATVSTEDTDAPMTLLYRPESDSYRYVQTAKLAKEKNPREIECDTDNHFDAAAEQGVEPSYPQHRIEGCGGHFGGSIDGLLTLPAEYCGLPMAFINEYKTSGTGRGFTLMLQDGVQATKYEHFCQMSIYGFKRGIKYGVYMMINKNDDDLHVEVVQLDFALAQRLEAKAHRIIISPVPPPKISESLTYKTCTYCDMLGVCHKGSPYEKNCRSCANASPLDNKQWHCAVFQGVIPPDFIPKGCDNWREAR